MTRAAPGTDGRRRAESRGRGAELLAALLLILKGHRILARRARTPAGEIDLIARKGRMLVFAEVKARASLDTGTEALTPRQRDRIARAAEAFVRARPDLAGLDWRFDLIVAAGGWRLRHLKDAWRPGLG
ncbi:MAG: YraN family protein [Rhodospirillales bacterium]|tara:strand:- start:194 stop:580 length:387 start_codon:yes stop_codon:yes gene_type:complete